jgi:uncharacterized protein (DUF2235 family)
VNIVVCIDGLHESASGATNLFKLYNMLEDRSPRQIAFYDHGFDLKSSLRLGSTGMSAKICRAYEFIFEHFQAADKIYLLGSGVGAATVTVLAEMLHLFGVLPFGHSELIRKAYAIFNIKEAEIRHRQASNFLHSHHTMWVSVPFLGIWDSVLTKGRLMDQYHPFGSIFKCHNFDLPETVKNCYHALAIDEERRTLRPRILDNRVNVDQTINQVWFCGSHADICGGYPETMLSDITLGWMKEQATAHGLRIYPFHRVDLRPDHNGPIHGPIHDPSKGLQASYYQMEEKRFWNIHSFGPPMIHSSVLARVEDSKNSPNPYLPWILDDEYRS